jgi:hypothetical protein
MMKPKNPEDGIWKENLPRRPRQNWKPTSSFLMEKYIQQRQGNVFNRLGGYKQRRSPEPEYGDGTLPGARYWLTQLASYLGW